MKFIVIWDASPCKLIGTVRSYSPEDGNVYHLMVNPLKTKRKLLYLKTQTVPLCKHFSSRL